jgi:hypothetical protein
LTACECEGSVEKHFSGGLDVDEERALRAHLPGCNLCRARYHRHLLLEALDPAASPVAARLARGLGLAFRGGARGRARAAWSLGVLLPLAGVAALLLVWARHPAPGNSGAGFQSRGAARAELHAFRLATGRAPRVLGDRLGSREELAFAYKNPTGRRYLLVFAVDEHRHVYWYHPAWSDERSTPTAVPIERGPETIELPEGIAHAYDGQRLVLHTLFTDRAVSVREVEELVRTDDAARLGLLGQHLERTLRVEREATP